MGHGSCGVAVTLLPMSPGPHYALQAYFLMQKNFRACQNEQETTTAKSGLNSSGANKLTQSQCCMHFISLYQLMLCIQIYYLMFQLFYFNCVIYFIIFYALLTPIDTELFEVNISHDMLNLVHFEFS
jgi:hypothetical protein